MRDADLIELLAAAKHDPRAADRLIRDLEAFAFSVASSYFIVDGDKEDLHQEARIGLLKGIRSWDPVAAAVSGTSPRTFLALCIRRNVITNVKRAQRLKNQVLNDSKRAAHDEDGVEVDILSVLPAIGTTPRTAENRDELGRLSREIRTLLSPLEARVVLGFANGLSYRTIGDLVGLDAKAVDNAFQRARKKLQNPKAAPHLRGRKIYECPGCGRETVIKRGGRGRPPRCNVCNFRAIAA